MYLYFLRHGDALTQGYDDASRPLSPLGEEEVKLATLTLKKLGVSLDAVLSSSLLRAKQTAEIVLRELGIKKFIITEYLVPGTDSRQLISELNELGKNSTLLVGHEPYLSSFISLLIGGSQATQIAMKKAGIACVESPVPIKSGNSVLRWLLSPEQMKHVDSSISK